MPSLYIKTRHPETTRALMLEHELVEPADFPVVLEEEMTIDYHSDGLSQELYFWFALAQGCGLIEEYSHEEG